MRDEHYTLLGNGAYSMIDSFPATWVSQAVSASFISLVKFNPSTILNVGYNINSRTLCTHCRFSAISRPSDYVNHSLPSLKRYFLSNLQLKIISLAPCMLQMLPHKVKNGTYWIKNTRIELCSYAIWLIRKQANALSKTK